MLIPQIIGTVTWFVIVNVSVRHCVPSVTSFPPGLKFPAVINPTDTELVDGPEIMKVLKRYRHIWRWRIFWTHSIYNFECIQLFLQCSHSKYFEHNNKFFLNHQLRQAVHKYSSGPNNSVVLNKHGGWTIYPKSINVWFGIRIIMIMDVVRFFLKCMSKLIYLSVSNIMYYYLSIKLPNFCPKT